MTAFFHDEHTASAACRWRNRNNITVWVHPNRDGKNEHYSAHTGSPLNFCADTQEAAERKCCEHFGITHYKDEGKT